MICINTRIKVSFVKIENVETNAKLQKNRGQTPGLELNLKYEAKIRVELRG